MLPTDPTPSTLYCFPTSVLPFPIEFFPSEFQSLVELLYEILLKEIKGKRMKGPIVFVGQKTKY